jgi:hypothetical protein
LKAFMKSAFRRVSFYAEGAACTTHWTRKLRD